MPSTTIRSLPPELLRRILALSQPQPMIETSYTSHRASVRNYLSFSLVHPSWTSIAQSLLAEHLFIVRGEAQVPAIIQGVESQAFKSMPIKGLTLGEGAFRFGKLLEPPFSGRWSTLTYLKLQLQLEAPLERDSGPEIDFKRLAEFPKHHLLLLLYAQHLAALARHSYASSTEAALRRSLLDLTGNPEHPWRRQVPENGGL
ncbi:hypothetical protein JCM5350_005170 [Sporobolomyces pararoseus]